MQDFGEYLRAYWTYVRIRGRMKALAFVLVWLAGMFVPARGKDACAIAGLARIHLDVWLGNGWLCSCTLWNVETTARRGYQTRSAGAELIVQRNLEFRHTSPRAPRLIFYPPLS